MVIMEQKAIERFLKKYTPGSSDTSIDEKREYLQDAIKNGGYYGEEGVWNSIIVFDGDNHIYRGRVETLIIKDGDKIFLRFKTNKKNDREYSVPGGSFERDISNIDQAVNECKEEARINVRNIRSSGITYKETVTPPKWAIGTQAVNWNGKYTEVYVGEFDGYYTGHIDKVDEDKFMVKGKFYSIADVYDVLRKEHKEAIKNVYPDLDEKLQKKIYHEATNPEKIRKDILDTTMKVLRKNGYKPNVEASDRTSFIKTGSTSDFKNCVCIAGFKPDEVSKAASLVNKEIKVMGGYLSPDNYGTCFLRVSNKVITEAALNAEKRNALSSKSFGIPSLRKFPLNDRDHVLQAIRFFNTVDKKHEKELAHNIIKAMRHYKIPKQSVGDRNRLKTYLD
jgi:hypothetical protein